MKCPDSIEELQELELPENWKQDTDYVYMPILKTRFRMMMASPRYKKPEEIMKTYFISDGNFIKIGKAINVCLRKSELQTGNPNTLVIFFIIHSDLERLFHIEFKKCKKNNEWFDLPKNWLDIVLNILEQKQFDGLLCEDLTNG